MTIYNATLKSVLCWVKKAIELTLGATTKTQFDFMKHEHTCFQLLKWFRRRNNRPSVWPMWGPKWQTKAHQTVKDKD